MKGKMEHTHWNSKNKWLWHKIVTIQFFSLANVSVMFQYTATWMFCYHELDGLILFCKSGKDVVVVVFWATIAPIPT